MGDLDIVGKQHGLSNNFNYHTQEKKKRKQYRLKNGKNFTREWECRKKQMKISEIKDTIYEIKYTIDGFNID